MGGEGEGCGGMGGGGEGGGGEGGGGEGGAGEGGGGNNGAGGGRDDWSVLGAVMVVLTRVTAVCARTRPLREEPALKVATVFTKKTPSRCEVVPASTNPATCQKMFDARAPPLRRTRAPPPTTTSPATLKMKTSEEEPRMVMSPAKETDVVHPCTPASKVWPVMRPAMRLRFTGAVARNVASAYAASISRMAVPSMAGVGAA